MSLYYSTKDIKARFKISSKNNKYNYNICIENMNDVFLTSKFYDEKFMDVIAEIFGIFVDDYHMNLKSDFNPFKSSSPLINKFISDHQKNNKDYSIEETIRLLIQIDKSYNVEDDNKLDDYVNTYMKIRRWQTQNITYASVANYKKFVLTRPYFSDFTHEEFKFYDSLNNKEKLLDKLSLRKLFKLQLIYDWIKEDNNSNSDMLVKDFGYDENYQTYKKSLLDYRRITDVLPLSNKKFIDFLDDLKISEVCSLFKKIPKKCRVTDALILAESMLEESKENNFTVVDAMDAYNALIKKTNGEEPIGYYSKIHNFILNNFKDAEHRDPLTQTLCDYFNKSDEISSSMIKFIVHDVISTYAGMKQREVWKILTNKLDSVSFFNVIKDVKDNELKLNVKQWKNYADNYDEYKDLPVSWWVELV